MATISGSLERAPRHISDELWAIVSWRRGGRRGLSQRLNGILQGLNAGALSNSPPWVVDWDAPELYGARINWQLRDELEEALTQPPRVIPTRRPIRPSATSQRERSPRRFQGLQVELDESSGVYNRCEDWAWSEDLTLNFRVRDSISTPGQVYLLSYDWHQVVDRAPEGRIGWEFNHISPQNIATIVEHQGVVREYGLTPCTVILSYLHSERTRSDLLHAFFATERCAIFDVIITTSERTGHRQGHSGKVRILREIVEAGILAGIHIDDSHEVQNELLEFQEHGELRNLQGVHIKLPRKHSCGHVPACKWLTQTTPYLRDAVRRFAESQ